MHQPKKIIKNQKGLVSCLEIGFLCTVDVFFLLKPCQTINLAPGPREEW